jgi:hypothetical protein
VDSSDVRAPPLLVLLQEVSQASCVAVLFPFDPTEIVSDLSVAKRNVLKFQSIFVKGSITVFNFVIFVLYILPYN